MIFPPLILKRIEDRHEETTAHGGLGEEDRGKKEKEREGRKEKKKKNVLLHHHIRVEMDDERYGNIEKVVE